MAPRSSGRSKGRSRRAVARRRNVVRVLSDHDARRRGSAARRRVGRPRSGPVVAHRHLGRGNGRWTKGAAKRQRRAYSRALARAKRGSTRRLTAKRRLARHSAATANRRRDFLHTLSRSLVDRDAVIALEDLGVDRLTRSMLAKVVRTAMWGQRRSVLKDKAANAGVRVEAVDPRGTSQTCPACGAVVAKTLADRTHRCDCGCVMDRDVAAATVILQRAHGMGPGHGLRTPSQRGAAELVREAVAL